MRTRKCCNIEKGRTFHWIKMLIYDFMAKDNSLSLKLYIILFYIAVSRLQHKYDQEDFLHIVLPGNQTNP